MDSHWGRGLQAPGERSSLGNPAGPQAGAVTPPAFLISQSGSTLGGGHESLSPDSMGWEDLGCCEVGVPPGGP